MAHNLDATDMPVVARLDDFDRKAGNLLERLIFNNRLLILVFSAVVSVFLGGQALHLRVNANYEQMLPLSHPYVQNYIKNQRELGNLGNTLRIAVENKGGSILDPEYLTILQNITDRMIVTKGVNRSLVKSLWLPTVRWTDVTAEGYAGGSVMPDDFDNSPEKVARLKYNILRARIVGSLVSPDFKSSMVVVPLIDRDPETGQPLDYQELSQRIESDILSLQTDKVRIHIVGFAQLVGDLIDGLHQVIGFFAVAALIATLIVYNYTRCIRSTVLLISVSLLGVLWLLGLIALLGRDLNPYSVLVPFLIFAIGVSHGMQKMNSIARDVARGTHHYVAARYTFRRLFLPGITALLTNALGFAVLMVVNIPVIRELALFTSIGVTILIFTKLMLVPVIMSYIGLNRNSAELRLINELNDKGGSIFRLQFFERFTRPLWAYSAVVVAFSLFAGAYVISEGLQVGDLDKGAPELWPNSRYNQDVDFVNHNFGLSSDQFAVIVKTKPYGGQSYDALIEMQRLDALLREQPGVQLVQSLAEMVPGVNMGQFEGNPKWFTIPRSSNAGAAVYTFFNGGGQDYVNAEYSVMPSIAYLKDHRAATLSGLLKTVEDFAAKHDTADIQFLPIAGSAGMEAVTNIVVKKAQVEMLTLLYASVIILCFITFRSWRAVIVALVPLIITAVICEALMVKMNIGLKVATLPVHALGVGVGVDYALYLLSIQLAFQRQGASLAEAYAGALKFTGRVVALIGITMGISVFTWAWSPIKFQANMGILLAFMFIWNMIGALVLIPALSYFLLRNTSGGHVRAHGAKVQSPATAGGAGPSSVRAASMVQV